MEGKCRQFYVTSIYFARNITIVCVVSLDHNKQDYATKIMLEKDSAEDKQSRQDK